MSGTKPEFRIWVKAKEGDRSCNLIAVWRNDGNRLSGKFDQCVRKFTVEIDGELYDIDPSTVWVNMQHDVQAEDVSQEPNRENTPF